MTDNFLIDKVMFEIGRRETRTNHEFRLTDHDTVEKVETEKERIESSLTDAHIKAIAALAKEAEKRYGCPQDIEWASMLICNRRERCVAPVTSGNRGARSRVTLPRGIEWRLHASIVSTLMNLLHARSTSGALEKEQGKDSSCRIGFLVPSR